MIKLRINENEHKSNEGTKLLNADELKIKDKLIIPNDEYSYVICDTGCYDLVKKGINPIYCGVGKKHKGSRNLTSKQISNMRNFVYDVVVPAIMNYCNVKREDVKIDDFTNSMDMFRVWVDSDIVN